MPSFVGLPFAPMPGVRVVTLIGSSMQYFAPRSPKPCQACFGFSSHGVARARELIDVGVEEALVADLSVCQLWNHQSPDFRFSRSRPMRSIARRKSIASRMHSSVSAGPGVVHHLGRDVRRRDDAVLRRGRGVHHEGFVEERGLDRDASLADVDHRGLRERGEQLVGRVRHRHRRIVLRSLAAVHAVAALVQRVEARVGVPRLVVVDAVDALLRTSVVCSTS